MLTLVGMFLGDHCAAHRFAIVVEEYGYVVDYESVQTIGRHQFLVSTLSLTTIQSH